MCMSAYKYMDISQLIHLNISELFIFKIAFSF